MSKKKINNFLKPNQKKSKSSWLKKKGVLILLSSLSFLIVVTAVLYIIYKQPAQNVYQNGIYGKDAFISAQNNLMAQRFELARGDLDLAINHFQIANDEFKKFKWLTVVPWLGSQISAIDNLLIAGLSTGESIQKINDLAIDIIIPLQKDDELSLATLTEEETESLLKSMYESKPTLEEAKNSIDFAVQSINKISDKGLLNKIRNIVTPLKEQVPQLQSGIDQAISASQIIPSIAGYPEPKTYLFLLQNNTEMRPTGGFIGTYGILRVKNGDIDHFKTDNSYNLDEPAKAWLNIEPPWPLTRYNAVHKWFFRDSNWSPDFPTSAEKAEWFYKQERGPEKKIDGIIAVTPVFIQSLLTLTGNIPVNGLVFNEDNFIETLQYQVDQGYLRQNIADSERKEIIGVLSQKLLDEILSLPKSRWPDLWQVFTKDISEKHILMYVKDDYVQKFIEKENWGGKIKQVDHDYFAIFDANLASLKSDPGVKRTITYQLSRDSGNLIADLTISYRNEGTITWKTTRYRSYVRVYVPPGSNLLKTTGAMVDCKLDEQGSVETVDEFNKTSFGTFICIEPNEEKQLSFKYRLPDSIYEQLDNNQYQILIQKQPGTDNYELNINLNLKNKPDEIIGVEQYEIDSSQIDIKSELSSDKNIIVNY